MCENQAISIIIPSYNNVELFENAITSILSQTLLPKEIIISDDSTSNEIELWCSQHPNPIIKYHHNKPAKGAVANWNYGITKSTGDWIILLHHDEALSSPQYLEQLSSHFNQVDLVLSDIRIKTPSGIRKGRITGFLKKLLITNPLSLLVVNSIGPCACICFKRDILIVFDTKLTWLVDVEWYMRLLKRSPRVIYDSNLIIQSNHGHSDQITNNIDISAIYKKDITYLVKKYASSRKIQIFLYLSKMFNLLKSKIPH